MMMKFLHSLFSFTQKIKLMCENKFDIYKNGLDNKLRFTLGRSGTNPLFIIGLNPSTADANNGDRTINKVAGITEGAKLDGFVMLNLYPQRATDPNDLDKMLNEEYHQQNILAIKEVVSKHKNINVLLAFGNMISSRAYLKDCFKDIYSLLQESNPKWMKTGELTKAGHPRHPLYVAYAKGLSDLNMEEYITLIG